MITRALNYMVVLLPCLLAAACNSTSVRTTEHIQVVNESTQIQEDQLLDVGIGIFDPGVDELSAKEEGVFPAVRNAEARYMPFKLMETLQMTGNWGVVRVIPDRQSEMDLWVDSEILKSDGETLELRVKVADASGQTWFTRVYKEIASKYSYDNRRGNRQEPFQGIYNRIANDMLAFRKQLGPDDIKALRTVTELKFAQRFAPEVFGGYLVTDEGGRYKILRTPAADDPVLQRVRKIRERDYMFVDTLQDYYGSFTRKMEAPYRSWRSESYYETMALREVKQKANSQLLGGALAVVAGILGAASDNDLARVAGAVGVGAGAYMIKEGLSTREEAKMHVQALEELGASLDAEVQPHTITLEDRTVTLSGTVDDQYAQWRQILKDIYQTETGQIGPITN